MTNQTGVKHAATPWKVGFKGVTQEVRIETNDGKCSVGTVWGINFEANATFIVKAVNSHALLVEACRIAVNSYDLSNKGYSPKPDPMHIQVLREALKQAEE